MKRILLLLFLISNLSFAQNKKGQNEIALPLHPWLALSQSLYVDFEHFKSPKRSTTFRAGYQGDNLLFMMWSKMQFNGIRADYGQRWYLKGETSKVFRFFAGVNGTLEYSKMSLRDDGFGIARDSMQTKGLSFAPEINAGLKIVALKHFTITGSMGFRYYFNTMNTDKLTKNPSYWAYNDWDNMQPTWQENRREVELRNFRKGFMPVPYLHFGWIF
ncbi:MAG: hypothetical protein IPH28_05215 [Cytophagaceae bacterium]|nr:hypothetical protein [Cytophagaceae bacterium]MBK9508921.1 hypothetical protein [Cytophagaceae bacterium]MBK9935825.1 hypothetical protein [Cytophagaceae bacterium]MBL0325084.1 hypothetical protein [Cytophagaceae bacterium]